MARSHWLILRENFLYRITSEDVYRERFPGAMQAIERAFARKESVIKKTDFVFAGLEAPDAEGAHHKVIYEPRRKATGEWEMTPVTFSVFFRQANRILSVAENETTVQFAEWWEVQPPFHILIGTKWG